MTHRQTDQYVQVILEVPLGPLDYWLDETMSAVVGDRVLVTLQRRKMIGIVTGLSSETAVDPKKIKKVTAVLSETAPFSEEWLRFTKFTSDYYIRRWGEVAISVLPKFFRLPPRLRRESTLEKWRIAPTKNKIDNKQTQLNAEQTDAVKAISHSKGFRTFCLYGVTGSGKTEVYLSALERVLKDDSEAQVLLLVPEINLTPQLEARVKERFCEEYVTTLHSSLSDGERAKSWLAVHEGRSRVLVGTRMAVFASFKKLAMIVVDEEHDASYKAGDGMRYSARDLAVKRAQINAVPCVLGSATPSLETWMHAKTNAFSLLKLTRRAVASAMMPTLDVVSTRGGASGVFSERAREAITETIERKEQVLVYINRRGFAPIVTCSACGWVSRCVHCSGFTVFHKRENKLICHHCGTVYPIPAACPTCGNVDLEAIGTGTQKIEESIKEFWPDARVLRIDRDAVQRKGEAEEAFSSVHRGEVDIVVGTQMISKGHDFQKVTLVVVLNADAQLVSPDLRAEERLFSTLMQVSGRAGRSGLKGRVIIQTRFPDHPIYEALEHQNFDLFANRLLEERKESFSPPYTYQAILFAQSETLYRAMDYLKRASHIAMNICADVVRVYDPVPMSLVRLQDVERAQLLVEADSRSELNRFLRQWEAQLPTESSVVWTIEVDPWQV